MPSALNIDSSASIARTRYSVDVVSCEPALEALGPDWNRLLESVDDPNAFMTHGWFQAWTKQLVKERGNRYSPYIVVLRKEREIAGIVPLVRRIVSSTFRVRKLEFSTDRADYNDVVVGEDQAELTRAFAEFLAHTAHDWDLVDLNNLRNSGNGTAVLETALAHAGLPYLILHESQRCPFLEVQGDGAHIMNRLSGHVRRTLRKRMDRAEGEGLRVRIIENPAQEPDLLNRLLPLDRQKHLDRSYPPLLSSYPEVFQSLFDNLGPRGWIYVALLELGERPIAFQLGFCCGKKLWDYSKAYDRAFIRFAPGTLLLPKLYDYCFQHGFSEYDFLAGEEPYKTLWSTGYHERYRVLIWNRRKISLLRKLIYYDIKLAMRRLLHKTV